MKQHELIPVKKTQFVTMSFDEIDQELHARFTYKVPDSEYVYYRDIVIPIRKIPSVMRGLLSTYQRFYRKK